MALLPPIGPLAYASSGPWCSSLSIYLLSLISCSFLHHCILTTSVSLSISMLSCSGLGSGRSEHSFYSLFLSICHFAAVRCMILRHCNVSSCPAFCPYVQVFIFFILCTFFISCHTLCVPPRSHSTPFSSISLPCLSHTPRIPPTGPPTPPSPSDSRHPRIVPYTRTIAFRNLACIFIYTARQHTLSHRHCFAFLMPPARIVLFPYAS